MAFGDPFGDPFDPLQKALGQLSMEFSSFETHLACAVAFLAHPREPRIGLTLVAEMSFKGRLNALSSLYLERCNEPKRIEAFGDFRAAAFKFEQERNKFIHSFYWRGPTGSTSGTRIKATAKKEGLNVHFEDITAEQIQSEAAVARHLSPSLDDLMNGVQLEVDWGDYLGQFYSQFGPQ